MTIIQTYILRTNLDTMADYRTVYRTLPKELQRVLKNEDIIDANIESTFYHDEHQDTEVRENWITQAIDLAAVPLPRHVYERELHQLHLAARTTKKRALDHSAAIYDMEEAKRQHTADTDFIHEQKRAAMY